MTVDLGRWPHADDLLDRALELPVQERDAFLRRAAGTDTTLYAVLTAVLAEASNDDAFLAPGGALSGTLGQELMRAAESGDEPSPATAPVGPGARIEHYEVLELIGRGGMGEVYRARDTRLQRDVALKILPDRFARDPERVARFRREARTLASLSHSGIGAIYGVAETGDVEALVLELIPGPTLAERFGKEGGALPLDEALAVGRRLAEAIEAAHARGILHRDLKPANIKVAPDGSVKILDFGLAKAFSADAVAQGDGDITAQTPGMLLGTAAYMSPEQLRGQPADQRADIWAFGCVLFEMLSGTRAFAGNSTTDVIARVLETPPPFSRLPPDTPSSIQRLLRRCLEKSPRKRLGYIGDAILDFDDAAEPGAPAVETRPGRKPWRYVAAIVAGAAIGAAAFAAIGRRTPDRPAGVARFMVPLPSGDTAVTGFQPMIASSPDGRFFVYRARRNGVVQLFRRSLGSLEPEPIAGTEEATGPFFSPDGRWLGFDSDGVLKRVALAGGLPVVICPAPGGVTATWTADDAIVFATNTGRVLERVAASGGQPAAITTLDAARGDTLHLLPQALPDGSLLFTIVSGPNRNVALRLASGEIRVLAAGTHGRYLPSGHLVFWRDGSLWGATFDARRQAIVGTAAPLVEGIQHTDGTVLHFDVGADGSIVYLPAGEGDDTVQRLVWIDRAGRETPVDLEPRPYTRVALSPDGTRIALAMRERGNTDVWVADSARRTFSRLTFESTIETAPTWSRDGKSVAFRSEREGPGIFRRDAQGAGPIERLTETDGPIHSPYSWTPDGRTLLFALFRSFRSQAIASVTPPDRSIRILLDGDFAQLDPQVSPDGRWMAYQSDESGRFEVYVRPYPAVETGRWQISTAGGTSPRWSPDGRELFFVNEAGLMTSQIGRGAGFSAAPARRLFEVKPFGGRLGADFEVAGDARRFLFILDAPSAAARPAQLAFVQNWVDELRSRLGGADR